MRYYIEVRDSSDDLIARLENAYEIRYVAQVNAPHILEFKLPAWDTKATNLTLANEYWLIKDDEGPAMLTGYTYRKKITVTHSATETRRVKIAIVRGAGVDSFPTIYLDSRSLNWPYDIRFTDSDGVTLIDFWRMEYDAVDGTWYVEFPSLVDGDRVFYIYTGFAAAADVSDGEATFDFFDDFPGVAVDLAKWTPGGTYGVAAGECTLTGTVTPTSLVGTSTYEYGKMAFKAKAVITGSGYYGYLMWGADTAGVGRLEFQYNEDELYEYTWHDGANEGGIIAAITITDYHDYEITWTNAAQKYYVDAVLKATDTKNPHGVKAPNFYAYLDGADREDIILDWVFVDDSWTADEPTFVVTGNQTVVRKFRLQTYRSVRS